MKFIIYLRPWSTLWPVFIVFTLKIFLQTSTFIDMTNMSMVTIIDYNDRIYVINLNPLDPDCRIAVSAVYRALGTLNIAINAPLRHHQPHHQQQRANKELIKRAGTRDDAEADIVQHMQCSRQEGRRQVPNLQIWQSLTECTGPHPPLLTDCTLQAALHPLEHTARRSGQSQREPYKSLLVSRSGKMMAR